MSDPANSSESVAEESVHDADAAVEKSPVEPVAEPVAEPIPEAGAEAAVEPSAEKTEENNSEAKVSDEKVAEIANEPVVENTTPVADKAGSATDPAAVTTVPLESKPPGRASNVVVGLCLAMIGVLFVGLITLFTPPPTKDQDLPYLLSPLEKHLDAHMRYKLPAAGERKNWRNDFVTEQTIWTNEISKIMLGRPEAKPLEDKRDFLLYLADSFFRDEPHYGEAKAAYINANSAPRIPHEKAYDMGDDELWRRIGYCDMRLRFYGEAESWLKKAYELNEKAMKSSTDIQLRNTHSKILDNLAETYTRRGEPKKAEEVISQRLKEMRQPDAAQCVEWPVLYNIALAKEKEGDLKEAERFYKLAVAQAELENPTRTKVIPESSADSNRNLARILMAYSHCLRLLHRNDDAIAAMRRALCIYDNPPS